MTLGRLLIIDDDRAIGETISSIARRMGFESHVTDSAGEFLEALARFQPTHIVLDLVMPGTDGLQLMVQLAKLDCKAQIIISSGMGGRVLEAARLSATENGLAIAGILSKPFMPAALRDMLEVRPDSAQGTGSISPATPVQVSETELREAISARHIYPVYQPKIHCRDGRLAGFEVLARWSHPSRGTVMPDQFIPVAEKTGLIDELTYAILDAALPWFAAHYGKTELTLAINLSARTASRAAVDQIDAGAELAAGFFGRLASSCEVVGLAHDRLIFELTETSAMEDPIASLRLLTRLRLKGFQLSLDDFGTGFSSMLQLVRLPFSEIKVDRSFVMTAMRSQESRTVIRSIVELGRSLGMKSTAEGVENSQTLEYLNEVGCDLAQGYHIARPMTAEKVRNWASHRPNEDLGPFGNPP